MSSFEDSRDVPRTSKTSQTSRTSKLSENSSKIESIVKSIKSVTTIKSEERIGEILFSDSEILSRLKIPVFPGIFGHLRGSEFSYESRDFDFLNIEN